MSLQFNFPEVSFLQFWLTLGVGILAIFFLSLYMSIFVWMFGKPMRKYLAARLQGCGIIQEYAHENVTLHLARVDNGEFTDIESKGYITKEKVPRKWYQVWIAKVKLVVHKVKPLISKSIVAINGVPTLLVWNVTPKLPERYTSTLEALVEFGYNTIDEIKKDLLAKQIKLDDVIEPTQITFKEFLELHDNMRIRNSVSVTADDVLNFNTKYLDEHPLKSVIEKTVSVEQKRQLDKGYQKYGFILIGLWIVGILILGAYKIYSGGR